jgi:hypothetical protein
VQKVPPRWDDDGVALQAEELEPIVAVDWSGRIEVTGQRRRIWAGAWTSGGVTLEAGRTREEL